MNADRRKELTNLQTLVDSAVENINLAYTPIREKLSDRLDDITSVIEKITELRNEEQEAFDNLPDSQKEGDKGEAMTSAIENMESAESGLQELAEKLETAIQTLEEYCEGDPTEDYVAFLESAKE